MKKCRACSKEKDLAEYYKHKQMSDGHLNICKKCTKKRIASHRLHNIERIRAYDRKRGKLSHRKELSIENTRKARKRNPLYNKTHLAVSRAIKKGILTRPTICTKCNSHNVKIEGHHEDYTKPLDVIWLCIPCHRKLN